jgi:hypothetical protein
MSLALRTFSLVLATTTLAGCLGLAPGVTVPPGGRETGRAFLIGEQPEAKGYGLYSYFLFGAPPTEATRERYLNLIAAYLESIPPVGSFKGSLERWELNIAYLPHPSNSRKAALSCRAQPATSRLLDGSWTTTTTHGPGSC